MKKARNGKVDFLKFIFSIVVIIYHFGNSVKYPSELFNKGYIAVEFFFIVSGFLFAKSLSKIEYSKESFINDSLRFMGKKYISFMPYHIFTCICTLILCFFVVYDKNIYYFGAGILNAIPDLFLLQMCGIKNMDMLGHEWYISAMLIVMFILTPIIIKYRNTYLKYIAPISFVFVTGYLYNNYDSLDIVFKNNGFVCGGLLRAFAEISLGCVCYAAFESGILDKFNKILLSSIELIIYLIVLFYADKHLIKLNDFTVMFLLAAAVTISFSEKTSLKIFNNKFVSFLGKLSFPIYLTQIFVRRIISQIDWDYGYYTHCLLYVSCVIVVSIICMLVMDNTMKLISSRKEKIKEISDKKE